MLRDNGQIDYVIGEVRSYLPEYKGSEQNHFVSDGNPTDKYLNKVEKVIYFLHGEAVMSSATIQKLDVLASKAINNDQRVLLETSYSEAHAGSKLLSKNRIAACKSYLKIKGVPEGQIVVAITPASEPSAKVNAFLK